jgi:hypothetical protein
VIEDVVTDIKTSLTTNLGDELDRQDTKYADGITLEDVPTTSIYLGLRQINEGLPAILIVPESADQELWATQKKDVEHTISVGVAVTDTDELTAYKRLWRTIRAIENVFEIDLEGESSNIFKYETIGLNYDAGPFQIENLDSIAKAGIITGIFTERLDSYNSSQL